MSPSVWEQRLRVYPAAVLAAFALAFGLQLVRADGVATTGGRLGGDFPAFYSAGALVLEGRAADLYDWEAQAEAQVGLHPDAPGSFFQFAYPPYVAVAYAPLARLGFLEAYTIHTLAMAACLLVAVVWMAPLLPAIGRWRLALFAAWLAFYPMLRAVSGQNTALSALLVVGVWRALDEDWDAGAGLALGLLLYKPQLALPLAGLVAVLGRPRVLLWAALPAALYYAVAAAALGWAWPALWWEAVGVFQARDQTLNASHSVGLLGVLEAVLGPGSALALAAGGLATAALALYLARDWHRRDRPLDLKLALACCGLVLIPPHSMYYEAGLVGLALAVLAERALLPVSGLAALYAASFLEPLSELLGVNPLFAVVLAVAWCVARAAPAGPGAQPAGAGPGGRS